MKKILIIFMLFFQTAILFAQPIDELVFFGDSLSDNGNLYRWIKIIPKSPPYYEGRFSNGAVWSDYLSASFKNRYDVNSKNYGVGGATTLYRSPIKGALPYYLKREINNYIGAKNSSGQNNVLYFMWIGANDYLDEKNQDPEILVTEVIDEIMAEIRVLIEKGGKNFVVMDLPDFSKTPYAKGLPQEQKERLSAISKLHHEKIQNAVSILKNSYPDFHFIYIDIFSFFNDMLSDIRTFNERYHTHIENLTNSCWPGGYRLSSANNDTGMDKNISTSVSLSIAYHVSTSKVSDEMPCGDPEHYVFWDSLHPTTVLHQLFANIVEEKIELEMNFHPGFVDSHSV